MKKRKGQSTRYKGVKALGSGRYRLRIYVTSPVTGRQKEVTKTVRARDAKEANRLRELEELRLREDASGTPREIGLHASMPFGQVADAWLEEVTSRRFDEDPAQLHLCPNTRDRYGASVRDALKPFFGEMLAGRIMPDHIRRWRNNLLDVGYARSTINGHHRVLKTILRTVGNEAAMKVPELNERPDARITRSEPNRLTGQELDRFLAVAQERWPQHYALILTLVTTTMRISTALALRWEDLERDTMEIIAKRRLSGSGKQAELIPGVKRDRFEEDAPPLLPEVLDALEAHRANFNDAQRASGLLFPSLAGGHHSRTVLAKPFADILHHAGIKKRFTPHGLRRTGAQLYGRTAGTRVAMSIAGHMTEAMHEHYTGVDAEEKQEASRRAFGSLKILDGGKANETGTRTGTQEAVGQEIVS